VAISDSLKNIPQSRLLIYLMIAGLLPLLAVLLSLFSSLDEVSNVEMGLQSLQLTATQKERKQAVNQALRSNFKQVDPFYVDKVLESLRLLQTETNSLKKIADNPNFADNEQVRRRLEFLTGSQNRLEFTESNVQTTAHFKEVTELLAHPVEVDAGDIAKILSLVEGVEFSSNKPPANRPQIILLEFKLDKKNAIDKNQVFQLNMKLLKREFL
jgi:hypothetical protein